MPEMINIVFCFDENMMRQACVSIYSLLESKKESSHFAIYCVCSDEALQIAPSIQAVINDKDPQSQAFFVSNPIDVSNGFETREITISTYFRLCLPELLLNVPKVIYSDVDIIFKEDISEIWNIDIDDRYLAGVLADVNINFYWNYIAERNSYWKIFDDWKGNYINAGFILMNLSLIREKQLFNKWKQLISEEFYYQDQDILNLTCKPAIKIFANYYNAMAFYEEEDFQQMLDEHLITKEEYDILSGMPFVIHYAGDKPWKQFDVPYCDEWWDIVRKNKLLSDMMNEEYIAYRAYKKSI